MGNKAEFNNNFNNKGRDTKVWSLNERVALVLFLVVALPLPYLAGKWSSDHYQIAIPAEGQTESCLKYSYFLIDLDEKSPKVGDFVSFKIKGIADQFKEVPEIQNHKKFKDGVNYIKVYAAGPGDRVTISDKNVSIEHKESGRIDIYGSLDQSIVKILKRKTEDFIRTFVVPEGEMFMLGTEPGTFDSRYWGTIKQEQVIGKAYGLY
jgi:conjugal transfer pilin signal peptidase TrbI